jgi:SAM-dependent methyltransferase
MHKTALDNGKLFFDVYLKGSSGLKVIDIGAQDVNGSLRQFCPKSNMYIGVDFIDAKGVDVVISDPNELPFENDSIDICVSSSCFEHSEFFWLTFNEIMRVLKPSGLFYLNAPSKGAFHRYPVDCWRFYPDSGIALQNWGRRSGLNTALLESFTDIQKQSAWNDFIAVFVKDESFSTSYPNRMLAQCNKFANGMIYGSDELINPDIAPEIGKDGVINYIARKLG